MIFYNFFGFFLSQIDLSDLDLSVLQLVNCESIGLNGVWQRMQNLYRPVMSRPM